MASADADSIDKNDPPIGTAAALRLLAMKFMAKRNSIEDGSAS